VESFEIIQNFHKKHSSEKYNSFESQTNNLFNFLFNIGDRTGFYIEDEEKKLKMKMNRELEKRE
jgi:hypothetical protein